MKIIKLEFKEITDYEKELKEKYDLELVLTQNAEQDSEELLWSCEFSKKVFCKYCLDVRPTIGKVLGKTLNECLIEFCRRLRKENVLFLEDETRIVIPTLYHTKNIERVC